MAKDLDLKCGVCNIVVTPYSEMSQFQKDGIKGKHDQLIKTQLCNKCINEFKRTRTTFR